MSTETSGVGHVFVGGQDGGGWAYLGTTDGIEWQPTPQAASDWEPVTFPVTASTTIPVTAPGFAVAMRLMHAMHSPWRPRNKVRISRCRLCNPRGNPPPLPIDGREYHRRQQARKRRRR